MMWAADQRIREISYIHSTDDENEEEDYADSEVCDGDGDDDDHHHDVDGVVADNDRRLFQHED
jgi:hypothetical protein